MRTRNFCGESLVCRMPPGLRSLVLGNKHSTNSNVQQISLRIQVHQTPHDVKLNRIVVFRRKADECDGYALSSLLTHNPRKHVQRGTNFRNLELQSNFLSQLKSIELRRAHAHEGHIEPLSLRSLPRLLGVLKRQNRMA